MLKRLIHALLLTTLVLSFSPSRSALATGARQQDPVVSRAVQLLNEMTPEERVGQLFLVAFKGSTANSDSQIYDLIVNHHVGGVMLQADNDNFTGSPNTVSSAYQLISQLQNAEYQASQPAIPPTPSGTPWPPPASSWRTARTGRAGA
jgi:beta-N-acetylhexosaminidase